MRMNRSVPRGRPKNPENMLSVERSIKISEAMNSALYERAAAENRSLPDLVRQAISNLLTGAAIEVADAPDEVRLKFLTTAPAGPWAEAVEMAGSYTLSRQVAEELAVREGDIVVRVNGESMQDAGIPDRALLIMRPLVNDKLPRKRQPALIQIAVGRDEDDLSYQSTIKKWVSDTELLDGRDDAFELPEATRFVTPVAEAVGIISSM